MKKPPQGFRTFQIILASSFLLGFLALLTFFIFKISNLNTDLNRISVASQLRVQIASLLADARACELNFAGRNLIGEPIAIRKIVNLRDTAIIRANTLVGSNNVLLNSMRIIPPQKIDSEATTASFDLEMVFSDKESNRQSPFIIPVTSEGRPEGKGFTIKSCFANLSGFEG